MLSHVSRSGAFPGLKATSKFKNQTWVAIPVGTKAAYVAAQALPKALVGCIVEAQTAFTPKAVGGDSPDDALCGGASLAGEACGTKATDALEKRGPIAETQSESLDPAAAPEDPAARLLLDKRRKEILWSQSRALALGISSDAPMPSAAASPPNGSASTTPTASPSAGLEGPAQAGLAITPFGAASLAGKARATVATGSSQLNALPFRNLETFVLSPPSCVELFVPNGVESVGVKRAGEDLEEAEGCGEGARGAVVRKKSKANAGDGDAPLINEDPATQVHQNARIGRVPALALSRVFVRPATFHLLAGFTA
jgi:hypothetical protein